MSKVTLVSPEESTARSPTLERVNSRLSSCSSSTTRSSNSSSTLSSTGSSFRPIFDGLPPELAIAAQDLVFQVAALGLDLNPDNIEAASHQGDALYREFVKAGARPNEFGELQISLGQFYRHLRGRKLTPTEQLQAIVDFEGTEVAAAASPAPSPQKRGQQQQHPHHEPPRLSRVVPAGPSRDGVPPPPSTRSVAEQDIEALSTCFLNFNQVSALIRHHTLGPGRRLRSASLAGNGGGSVYFSPDTRSLVSGRSAASVSGGNTPSAHLSPNGVGGSVSASQNQQQQQQQSGNDNQHQQQSSSARTASNRQNQQQHQHSPSPAASHYAGRGKGGIVSHSLADGGGPAHISANLAAWQKMEEEKRREEEEKQRHQQQEDDTAPEEQEHQPQQTRSSLPDDAEGSGESGTGGGGSHIGGGGGGGGYYAALPPDEAEADFEGEFGEHRPLGYLTKRDEMFAKIERVSQSPQRVHGNRTSDSVVPPHMRPGAKVNDGFGATVSEIDAKKLSEAEKRNQSPEKKIRKAKPTVSARAVSPEQRFRAFQQYQKKQEKRGLFERGASRPTSSFSMRAEYNHARAVNADTQQQRPPRPGSAFSTTSTARRTPAPPGASRPPTRNSDFSACSCSSAAPRPTPPPHRPLAFGYYDWFKSTNRSLPASATQRGYGSETARQQQHYTRPESRQAEEIPRAHDDDDEDDELDSMDRHEQQQQHHPQDRFESSFTSTAHTASFRPGSRTSHSRPGTSMSDNNDKQQKQSAATTTTPFLARATDDVVNTVPTNLLPERAPVAFAKLHEAGAAYMVRPSSAAGMRRQFDDDDEEDGDGNAATTRSPLFGSTRARSGNLENIDEDDDPVSWEGVGSRPTSSTGFYNTQSGSGVAASGTTATSGSAFGFDTQSPLLTMSMTLHQDEDPRIQDDDTTTTGLFKMLRAHWATRTIQRWYRVLQAQRAAQAAEMLQRIGRALVERRQVGAIPVTGDDGKPISRIKLYSLRLQRVGRGFVKARKPLAKQFLAESFDRDIGRFASVLGLRACLATAAPAGNTISANSPFGNFVESPAASPKVSGLSPEGARARPAPLSGFGSGDFPPSHSPGMGPEQGTNIWSSASGDDILSSSSPAAAATATTTSSTPLPSFRVAPRRPEMVRLAYAASAEHGEEQKEQQQQQQHQEQEQQRSAAPFFSRSRLKRSRDQNAARESAAAADAEGQQAEAKKNLRWQKPERVTSRIIKRDADSVQLMKFLQPRAAAANKPQK